MLVPLTPKCKNTTWFKGFYFLISCTWGFIEFTYSSTAYTDTSNTYLLKIQYSYYSYSDIPFTNNSVGFFAMLPKEPKPVKKTKVLFYLLFYSIRNTYSIYNLIE